MRVIVTAGPTREYIDAVRFITNASSGRMGCAVAVAAAGAGHDVTLLCGPVCEDVLAGPRRARCRIVPFVTVQDLKEALDARFEACDALVMTAAVGDFRPEAPAAGKLHRCDGPVVLRLLPTEDILAGLGARKRAGQVVVAFAVEDAPQEQMEAKARAEMQRKNADYVVLNTPEAMGCGTSRACIICRGGFALGWGERPKAELARHIVGLLSAEPQRE